ncbi:hypothetical protein EDB84DRAFT_1447513, partial [Lactarius hengduanensis]
GLVLIRGWGGNGWVGGAAGAVLLGWCGWVALAARLGGAVGAARFGARLSGEVGVARSVRGRGWRSGVGGNAVDGGGVEAGRGRRVGLATWLGWRVGRPAMKAAVGGGGIEAGRAPGGWRRAHSGDGWGSGDGTGQLADGLRRGRTGAGVDDGVVSRWAPVQWGEVGGAGGNLIAGSGTGSVQSRVSWPCRGGGVRCRGGSGWGCAEVAAKSLHARESGGPCPIEMMSRDGDNGMASVHTRERQAEGVRAASECEGVEGLVKAVTRLPRPGDLHRLETKREKKEREKRSFLCCVFGDCVEGEGEREGEDEE